LPFPFHQQYLSQVGKNFVKSYIHYWGNLETVAQFPFVTAVCLSDYASVPAWQVAKKRNLPQKNSST